ncbi:MAG TPA: glycosyltransferase family 39 protein [Acidimicrobiales bacterium]|nr:glycosyltransferase family 39 protein [Acidimicrobiales bacterium]
MEVLTTEPTRPLTRWLSGWRFVAAVALVAAIAHLPGFVRTEVLNPDEAFLATQAQVLNDGGRLYQDVVDRKPPVVPYLYAATFRITGSDDLVSVRVLALLAHILTALMVAAIARRRWGDAPGFAAAMLYLVASAGLVLEDSQAANFEVFMLPLMCGSVLLADRERTAASGLAAAVATLAKQVAATTMLPIAYLAWRRDRLRGIVILGASFAVPIAVVALGFGWHDFFFWVFTGTGSYLDASGSWSVVLGRGASSIGVFLAANLGALLLVVGAWRRRRHDLDLWLWLAAAFIGAAAGFRFFGHYFLQLAPPFALLAAGTLVNAKRVEWLRTAVLGGASIVVFLGLTLSMHPNVLMPYAQVADAIDARTAAGDHIFVWGQFPQAYWASNRRPATRFLTSGFLTGFGGGRSSEHVGPQYAVDGAWDDLQADLAADPPKLIVDASVGTSFSLDRFPQFGRYVEAGYVRAAEVDGVVLYVPR